MGSGWEEENRCLRSAGQKLGSKEEMVDSPSPSQKTNERCKYAAFRFIHQCEYPCGDSVASTSEKSKVQEEVATIKTPSLHTHSTLQTQNSGIPDELLLLEIRDQ